MRFMQGLGLCLIGVFVFSCGCGQSTRVKAPSALSYTTATAVYTKGVQIAPNNPTSSGGAVSSYTVSPAIPAGLSLGSTTGVVSGTPTAVTTLASYTVTATNSAGSTTGTLTITVNDQPPTGLSYATPGAIYAVRSPITPNGPTNSGGTATSYRVSPALPPGLNLSTTTGVISGTPTIITTTAGYTVTATNSGGNATATLTIETGKVLPSNPVIACSDIQQLDFPYTQITKAELEPANSTAGAYTNLPEHCLVQGIVGLRTGYPAPVMDMYGALDNALAADGTYGISFELRMPTTTWNGDFFFTGGSGNDGVVGPAVGTPLGGGTAYLPALYQGYAVITQDSGHVGLLDQLGNIKDVAGDQNNGFGYDPQARYDYGYQQTGTMTPIAKAILTAFYGTSPLYSYYLGCSNGGREAMVASQRWGDMFDGIVAGDPGFRLPHAAIAESWASQQFAGAAQAVLPGSNTSGHNGNPNLAAAASAADLNLVGQLVLRTCDALDGLQDGMIFNTAACQKAFDPATLSQLQCPGAKTATCLLPAQITAIRNVFAGPTDSEGHALYSAWPYDAGIPDPKWMMWTTGVIADYLIGTQTIPVPFIALNTTLGATSSMYLFSTPPNPSLNIFTVSMDDLNTAIHATDADYTQSAVEYMEATDTALTQFTAHNGKIIYYHGGSDPVFSMYDTVNYYDRLTAAHGPTTTDFARLFLIPGMNHCSGGLHALDSFDPLTAISTWVEQGKAPDSILARNSNTVQIPAIFPAPGPLGPASPASPPNTYLPTTWTRPLCPYPEFAQYSGAGDVSLASSFTCTAPPAGAASEWVARVPAYRK
jgi:feruloyl esterase